MYARARVSSLVVVSPVGDLVLVSQPGVYVIGTRAAGSTTVVAVMSDPIALSFPVVDCAYMSTVRIVKDNLAAWEVISIYVIGVAAIHRKLIMGIVIRETCIILGQRVS